MEGYAKSAQYSLAKANVVYDDRLIGRVNLVMSRQAIIEEIRRNVL